MAYVKENKDYSIDVKFPALDLSNASTDVIIIRTKKKTIIMKPINGKLEITETIKHTFWNRVFKIKQLRMKIF